MAEPGTEIAFVATVRAEPTQVAQMLGLALPSSGNYLEDVQVVPIGPTTFRITRRYVPQWAIILGVIGLFLCLLGILAVFVRDTEELTVDIQPDPEGSRVTMTGKGKAATLATIQNTLARYDGYAPASFSAPAHTAGIASRPMNVAPAVTLTPDGSWWWDGTAWQPTSSTAPPQSPRSPDGTQWWDGATWHPVPPAIARDVDPPSSDPSI